MKELIGNLFENVMKFFNQYSDIDLDFLRFVPYNEFMPEISAFLVILFGLAMSALVLRLVGQFVKFIIWG